MKRLMAIGWIAATCLLRGDEDGFVPLFNGRDLDGWVNANCAPETWSVRDGRIHCTGIPTGAMRTARQYENFILELEWRHLRPGGNSGVFLWGTPVAAPGVPFLRGIEVQVLDHGYDAKGKNEWYTTHGDVFPIHGATMKPFGRHNGMRSFPSEERSRPSPEWNHYRIVCTNGVIRLHVNGREVSGGEECHYRKGFLALESEGAPVEYRNLRIKELPSSGVPESLTAPADSGLRALFNGVDLRGWLTHAAVAARWRIAGERLLLSEGTPDEAATLWTEAIFRSPELVVDCRPVARPDGGGSVVPVVRFGRWQIPLAGAVAGGYQRYVIRLSGGDVVVTRNDVEVSRVALGGGGFGSGRLGIVDSGGVVEFMNLYAREVR